MTPRSTSSASAVGHKQTDMGTHCIYGKVVRPCNATINRHEGGGVQSGAPALRFRGMLVLGIDVQLRYFV